MPGKLILKNQMSLDGFVGTLNGAVEWLFESFDDKLAGYIVDFLWTAGLHIMGSKTYNDMANYWPDSTEPFATPMNEIPKAVFSNSLQKAEWKETTIIRGDLIQNITKLKENADKNIIAHGGAGFVQSLIKHDLVDEYYLFVHPVILGKGLPIFTGITKPTHLEVNDIITFPGKTVLYIFKRIA